MDGDQSAGRLYGLSFCTFYLAAHSHQQRAGEPKPSDSPAYPGRRYLSKHRVRTTTHHRCRRGDSRRLADRETVPQPGRFQTTGESDLRSLSVKLQKNSCLANGAPGGNIRSVEQAATGDAALQAPLNGGCCASVNYRSFTHVVVSESIWYCTIPRHVSSIGSMGTAAKSLW